MFLNVRDYGQDIILSFSYKQVQLCSEFFMEYRTVCFLGGQDKQNSSVSPVLLRVAFPHIKKKLQ